MKFGELKDYHFFKTTDNQLDVFQRITETQGLLVIPGGGTDDNVYLSIHPMTSDVEIEEIDVKDLVFTETELEENDAIV